MMINVSYGDLGVLHRISLINFGILILLTILLLRSFLIANWMKRFLVSVNEFLLVTLCMKQCFRRFEPHIADASRCFWNLVTVIICSLFYDGINIMWHLA